MAREIRPHRSGSQFTKFISDAGASTLIVKPGAAGIDCSDDVVADFGADLIAKTAEEAFGFFQIEPPARNLWRFEIFAS